MAATSSLASPLALTPSLALTNRIVATAHAPGIVADGIPLRGEADYWRRVAEGGAAMVIVGGTAVSPAGTVRRGIICEAWRPEAQPGLSARATAIAQGGSVPVLQLVHLGRETLAADQFYPPVGPSAVRSPRELTRPLALDDAGVAQVVADFREVGVRAIDAGFAALELHAAHGYLLAQFLSSVANRRPDGATLAGRLAPVRAILSGIRRDRPHALVGIRLSVGDEADCGLGVEEIAQIAALLGDEVAWVNLTVGMRSTYVRDMATESPPVLAEIARLRPTIRQPLIASQAFRRQSEMEAARSAGADLIGVARPLIADPDLPRKLLAGRENTVRPCVSCNEDCRAFDPTLLCSVNPRLAPPGAEERPAAPVRVRAARGAARRVAIVGAGPGGLEAALTLGTLPDVEVTLWERSPAIGGALAIAAAGPHRRGWQRLLDFYAAALERGAVDLRLGEEATAAALSQADAVIVAPGAQEVPAPWDDRGQALLSSDAIAAGPQALDRPAHVIVVDDGAGWWPTVSAVEVAAAAGAQRVSLVTPGTTFAGSIPSESRVQLGPRLRHLRLEVHALTVPASISGHRLELRNGHALDGDAVIAVGERRALGWQHLVPAGSAGVVAIGDGVVPRKVAHAIAEGRRAALDVAGR